MTNFFEMEKWGATLEDLMKEAGIDIEELEEDLKPLPKNKKSS